ncbi:MAG: response regulator transcription factor [Bacteroidia bacterium]
MDNRIERPKVTFDSKGNFPEILLQHLNADQPRMVFEQFTQLLGLPMAIVDITQHQIAWMCNDFSDYNWVQSTKERPFMLSDFTHREDLSRLTQDLEYVQRFSLPVFESMYQLQDHRNNYNWALVRAVPIQFDRNGVATHLLCLIYHMARAFLSSGFIDKYTDAQKRRKWKVFEKKISSREKDVLMLIAQAKTDEEAAEELMVSRLTVATHRQNLLKKVGVKNKVELMRYLFDQGLI